MCLRLQLLNRHNKQRPRENSADRPDLRRTLASRPATLSPLTLVSVIRTRPSPERSNAPWNAACVELLGWRVSPLFILPLPRRGSNRTVLCRFCDRMRRD